MKRKAHNKIDLTGLTFGKLLVLEDTNEGLPKNPVWLCKCDCGNYKKIKGKYLRNGDTKSCGCLSKGASHNRRAIGRLTDTFWNHLKAQAARRNIPFEITKEYAWALAENQNFKCALSDTDLVFVFNFRDEYKQHTASLDRIDSSKGYTLDNVQWVHKDINIMKNSASEEKFIKFCYLVTQKWLRDHPEYAKKTCGTGLPTVHTPRE
jgi:hypothetical protein